MAKPLASVICSATSNVARKGISKFVASGYIKQAQITNISWRLHKAAVIEIKINGSCKWYLPRDEQFQAQSLVLLDPPMLENA